MLLLLIGLLPSFQIDVTPRWQPIDNPGCVAQLPDPKMTKLEGNGPDDQPVKITNYRGALGKTSYTVAVSEFSQGYIAQPVKAIFDIARDGSLTVTGGKLVSEKEILLEKVPGREFIIKVEDAGFAKARVFVHNKLQYSVMIVTPNEKALDDENARKFYASFKLKMAAQKR